MLVKNSMILNSEFIKAFHKLLDMRMPAKQCLEVSSCIEDIMAQHQIVVRARRAVADKYCTKDEDGKPVIDSNGNIVFETPELQQKCMSELQEIYDEEIELALTQKIKISANELMTPIQIKLLNDIVELG
jgi:hypothetical protein